MKNDTPETQNTVSINLNESGKLDSMLYRFALGEKYHRFTAETVGDHCLPTTISDLQKRHSIYFNRKFIKVPNRFGGKTPVMLYWLQDDSLTKVRLITGIYKEVS
jgi:hypothetical protein